MAVYLEEMVEFHEEKEAERLVQLRSQEEEELARMLSERHGYQYADLSTTPVDMDALRMVPEAHSREARAAVFNITGNTVHLAVHSPAYQQTKELIDELKRKGHEVSVFMVSMGSLNLVWEKYKDLSHTAATRRGSLDISSDEIVSFLGRVKDLNEARTFIEKTIKDDQTYRTSSIVEIFLASGLALAASDIHIEPEGGSVRLRFRLDGILTDVTHFDEKTYHMLVSRLKLLSGLKLNIKNTTQDGRFSIVVGGRSIEIRTSVLPSEHGESIVMRLLDPQSVMTDLEKLGMNEDLLNLVKHEIAQPNGLIVTTGPTGSGKTTLLYAFLRKVYNPEIKIITLEDPIEYHMDGIVQTQANPQQGYDFASGLRSIMRQDPDVIMVGEMRDGETAKTAINAALTGHLVFSTLHTNNAAGAIPRLLELGVEEKIIPSALRIALAQRLVRVLCPACRQRVPLTGDAKEKIENVLKTITDQKYIKQTHDREYVWEPVGCEACNKTGYKGRVGIFEAIAMDKDIERVTRENPSERAIREAAQKQGLLTMEQDGVLKVLSGVTSLSELLRVVELG